MLLILQIMYDNFFPFIFLFFFCSEYCPLNIVPLSLSLIFSSPFYSGFSLEVDPWISSYFSRTFTSKKKRKREAIFVYTLTAQNFQDCVNVWTSQAFLVGFSDSSVGKESTCNAGDPGWFPGLGRSFGEGMATHSSILGLPWWLSW